MPLVKIEQINEDAKILIWHFQEESDFFHQHLQKLYTGPLPWTAMPEKRKREFLATRYLIQLGLPPGANVSHMAKDPNGSPGLRNPRLYFGISHTREYVSCVISKCQSGCDVERYQERILALAHRFMTDEEMAWSTESDRLYRSHLIWGIKESAFKTWRRKRIDWKKHIRIELPEWNMNKGNFSGTIGNDTGTLDFYGGYEYFPRFLFVWTLQR